MSQSTAHSQRRLDYREMAERFKQVSDVSRLHVLMLLGEKDLSVGDMGATIGMGMSALSRHLSRLRLAGIVICTRSGQRNVYALTDDGRNLRRLVMGLFN